MNLHLLLFLNKHYMQLCIDQIPLVESFINLEWKTAGQKCYDVNRNFLVDQKQRDVYSSTLNGNAQLHFDCFGFIT